jgi:cyclopropane fatty-acyl-phospholipid synthase-like methyltransferase
MFLTKYGLLHSIFRISSTATPSLLAAAGASLEDAQLAKLDALIAAAGITAGDRVLEIGCGWGSCAIRAVQARSCLLFSTVKYMHRQDAFRTSSRT